MKRKIFILWVLFCAGWQGLVYGQAREEFDGPFSSWANVKEKFGAKGNGKDDDTRAFQQAIDGLCNPVTGANKGPGAYVVIYLPAGTYCLSSTLQLKGLIGVSIIGEDPARTIIRWIGADKDTMLWTNGSSYFKVSRITWDANGRKDMEAIGIHWKDKWRDARSQSFAPLNIEISDCYFSGGFKLGISGGTTGALGTTNANDSEVTIRRCVFSNCTWSGIEIEGFNAIDYWIWDCRFVQCRYGVNNTNGIYHIFRSYFEGSTGCDVHSRNGYYLSVRGCYSWRPASFSIDEGASSNPFKRSFQDNTVVECKNPPVSYPHTGKLTFWGNRFYGQRDTVPYPNSIYYYSWAYSNYEVLSLHNVYPRPVVFNLGNTKIRQVFTLDDHTQTKGHFPDGRTAFFQTMDPVPVKKDRTVFEVPPGAGSDIIQGMLNKAAALKGQRPIVHFGLGTYYIDRALIIPAGSDMQLVGDGLIYSTVFTVRPGILFRGPFIWVKGPSYITIRDIHINYPPRSLPGAAILFEGVDQPGAQAHLDQVYSLADTSLLVKGLNYLYIEKDNSFFNAGNYISGGSLMGSDKGTAKVTCFGGQFARLTVDHNARFLAKDCWWEGKERTPVNLSGSGSVILDGAMIAPDRSDSMPVIRIGKFDGNISLLNMYVQGALTVTGDNPSLNLLVWNIMFYHKMDPLDFLRQQPNYKGVFAGLNTQCFRSSDPACKDILPVGDQFINVSDPVGYMDRMTGPDQQCEPVLYRELGAGKSNISISRISIGAMAGGIEFTL